MRNFLGGMIPSLGIMFLIVEQVFLRQLRSAVFSGFVLLFLLCYAGASNLIHARRYRLYVLLGPLSGFLWIAMAVALLSGRDRLSALNVVTLGTASCVIFAVTREEAREAESATAGRQRGE